MDINITINIIKYGHFLKYGIFLHHIIQYVAFEHMKYHSSAMLFTCFLNNSHVTVRNMVQWRWQPANTGWTHRTVTDMNSNPANKTIDGSKLVPLRNSYCYDMKSYLVYIILGKLELP